MMDENASVNMSQFRRRNNAVMREALKQSVTALADRIDAFMSELANFGAELSDEDDRASAQSILDYWAASLAGETGRPRQSVKLRAFERKSQPEDTAALPNASKENPFRNMGLINRTYRERLPGREDAIASILDLLVQHGVVFVIGPAGSGRSALVNAGVLCQLENASEPCAIFSLLTPGKDPLASLAKLIPQADAAGIAQTPAEFRANFEAAGDGRPGVLSIDNAEELFTRCGDQPARESFAAAVSSLYASGDGRRNSVIIILREEWAEQMFALKAFASVPRQARFRPPLPTAAELQRMIRIPAAAAGVTFESGIVEDLARELQGDMAALPLVNFMLMRLWSLSNGGLIDDDVYRRAGRPQDALGRVAKETYNSLSDAGKKAAQRLFLTLAVPRPGESDQGLVARSHRESRRILTADGRDTAMVEAIAAFENAGLLRVSTYDESTDDSLEIIHDGLLHRWDDASEWLVDEKRMYQERLEVQNSAALWQRKGRPDGLLLLNWDLVNKSANYLTRQSLSTLSSTEQELLVRYIEASKNCLERQDRRTRWMRRATHAALLVSLPPAILAALLFSDVYSDWVTAYNPINRFAVRDYAIMAIKNPDNENDKEMLHRLSTLQTISSMELDLSPAAIERLDLTGLKLYAPNFDWSLFKSTNLKGAHLENATFHNARFEGTNFPEAKLRFAQFQDATFAGPADFRSADLYGASFDRAQLCNVNFSEAGLGAATFWKASFPRKPEEFLASFHNAPWWLATGWTEEQLGWLQSSTFDAGAIAATAPFKYQINKYKDVVSTARDDFASAVAKNNLALELATWGVCIKSPVPKQCSKMPDAEQEANDAIKLMSEPLKRAEKKTSPDVKSRSFQKLATMLDTRGYIRLQKDDLNGAIADLKQAVQVGGGDDADPDIQFHYSVALMADNQMKDAIKFLKLSSEKRYRPSHELRHLWKYLSASTGEYKTVLGDRLKSMSLQAAPEKQCP